VVEPLADWRRPSLSAWICYFSALLLLAGLGTWQLERRAWKHAILAKVTAGMKAAPLALGASIEGIAGLDYRRVRVSGRFAHGRELYLSGRFHRARHGVHVITPLIRPGLPTVLVNRGWVPQANKDPGTRRAGQLQGPVTVTGIARTLFRRGLFVPDNDPVKGFWMTYAPDAMGEAAGTRAPLAVVVEADGTANPGGLPKGAVTRIDFRNDHLNYALTWYALAIALTVIFAIYHRPAREDAT
jgi:surfeit locus 1 family protein